MRITGSRVVLNLEGADSMKHVEPDDFIIHLRSFQGGIEHSRFAGKVSVAYTVLTPRPGVDPRFFRWALKSQGYVRSLQATVNQLRDGQSIKYGDFDKVPLPQPPADEQRAIADFLDEQTSRIDTLIDKQTQLITTLRERRSAVVSDALSGHELTRLRRLVTPERPMSYGILQCGEPVEDGVPYIGPSDMPGEGRSPELDHLRRTTREIAAGYSRSTLSGGDLVVSIGPAYGRVAVVDASLTGANLTQDTVRVATDPSLVVTRYLVWVLCSRETAEYWDSQVAGATFRRLNLGTLARTPVPLPDLETQTRVATDLDEQTAKVDLLIHKTEKHIALAKERRAALITAAVTGQIDVRSAGRATEGVA
ncbi:restriction endonuclease subunit S [Cellulomonas edaphi]|uniref:Restriction endonuclease subunit S n=1 Tax=Cellulomonas edaphi TaxID=3053468 RepID=A0ABT7S2M7_9CELL|nr:restriction endonuclease subunit S [Cellulomons edaphi]MDM7829874.1 restriction endonuclease subunit S [Cellulomons edaphi]